jgi:hypothetical protein
MKGIAKPSIYFSAYPLKAIEPTNSPKESSQSSPYLRALLSGRAKTSSKVRVFPMINPYKNPYREELKIVRIAEKPVHVPEDIELTEKQWFHNYE